MKKLVLLFLITIGVFSIKSSHASNGDTLIVNPNPFDSIAVIQFEIANNDTIWLDVFNATGSTVQTYFNGTVLASGSYTLNFNGSALQNGIYFVRLKINSKIQTVKLIKNSSAVGLKENYLFENISIYPNPTTSIINIVDEQNELQNSAIEIKDYLGQVVFNTPFTNQINLSDLSAGIYFLTIQNGSIRKTVKIVKQ